jgi:capsular polysaccharide biosynthesis protein
VFGAATCLIALGAAVGLIVAALTAQTYRSQVDLFVASADASQSASCSGCTVDLYAGIVAAGTSLRVTRPVLQDLGLNLSDAQLAHEIEVRGVPGRVLVAVTDSDRAQSDRLATAVAAQLTEIAPGIGLTGPFNKFAIRLLVVHPATSQSLGRPWGRDVLVGAGCGLLSAALIVLLLARRRRGTADG